jgi:hypothetical protein
MKITYAVTNAVKETEHRISVLWITESASLRTLVGSLGSTFSDIEECAKDEFISWLPHDTADNVMNFTAGTYTFDAAQGQWSLMANTPQ